ncbi:MAG: glycosyltransferase family 2 protein [Candidatus Neomarinimicrobiota bacterium]|nr:MAG: glycosyltransferase family 2 protein [Candidatus Neomarinimicrobiota bacterium]
MNDYPAVIIPIYRNRDYLDQLISRLPRSLHSHTIFIDDGSDDGSGDYLRRIGFHCICFPRNRGKGEALTAGWREAARRGYRSVIQIDGDLQHPPEKIIQFFTHPRELKYGYRIRRRSMPIHRKLSNFFTSLLISVRTGKVLKDSQCGFRGYHLQSVQALKFRERHFHLESEMAIKLGLQGIKFVPVPLPTVYGHEPSAIHPFRDTFEFVFLWFRSYFWT